MISSKPCGLSVNITSQELRMLSSVTINWQITKIVMNSGSKNLFKFKRYTLGPLCLWQCLIGELSSRIFDNMSQVWILRQFWDRMCPLSHWFFFILFFIKEPKRETADERRNILSLENIASSFWVLFKKRDRGMGHIAILLFTAYGHLILWRNTVP